MLRNGRIYPGTVFRISITFADEDGNPVDPTTIVLKVKSPCGTRTTYTYNTDDEIQKASTGVYLADLTPDRAGRWHFRWETTGIGTTVVQEDNFIVMRSPFVNDCYPRDYC